MKSKGRIEAILKALKDYGPMTRVDIELTLGFGKAETSRLFTCMINASPRKPQRAHISHYIYDQEGQKRYPRAVYAIGPGKNAKRPERNPKEVQKRSRDKRKLILSTNSVFNLALSIPYATRGINQVRRAA